MSVTFSAILTGAPDGRDDLVLQCSSLTANLRESTSSYVSLIVDPAQISDVLDRPNGKIDIYKSVNGATPVRLVSTNQQDARLDYGGASRSYRLTGTTTSSFTPFGTPALYPQSVITDRLLEDGRKSWQIDPSIDIQPGDTLSYYETGTPSVHTIDLVAIVASAKSSQMIISEAVA